DPLPTNTTFVSLTAPAGWATTVPPAGGTGTVSAARGILASTAGPQVFTLVVRVNSSTPGGATLSNTATVDSTSPDPNTANNSATQTTTVQTVADVAVTNVDAPDPVLAGNN